MAKDKKNADEFSNESLNLPEDTNSGDTNSNQDFGNEYNPSDVSTQNESVGDTITVSQTEAPELQNAQVGDEVHLDVKAKVTDIDDATGDVTLDVLSYGNEEQGPEEPTGAQPPEQTGANDLASILGGGK